MASKKYQTFFDMAKSEYKISGLDRDAANLRADISNSNCLEATKNDKEAAKLKKKFSSKPFQIKFITLKKVVQYKSTSMVPEIGLCLKA